MRSAIALAAALIAAMQSAVAHDYRYIDSDGCRLAYTDYGSGEPVIILHGFSGSFDPYAGWFADALAKNFRVIGIDQRGHGRSCKPHDADAYGKHFATDVVNLMDRLHLAKAHIVGHSMGGIVSMYLAANDPDRLDSAVTIGNGLFTHGELTLIGWLMRGMFAWGHVKAFFGGADDPAHAGTDEAALIDAVKSLGEMAVSEEQVKALKVPVLAMRGGPKDDPHDTVERLASLNPSVQTLRLESEDHVSQLSNPQFRAALTSFLSRLSAARPALLAAPPTRASSSQNARPAPGTR